MVAHLNFALVLGREVMNVVVGTYHECSEVAKSMYGAEAFAVEATQVPAEIGDLYHDGYFFRIENGSEMMIEPIPTDSEKIDRLIAENKALREELDAVSLSVLDIVGMEG